MNSGETVWSLSETVWWFFLSCIFARIRFNPVDFTLLISSVNALGIAMRVGS